MNEYIMYQDKTKQIILDAIFLFCLSCCDNCQPKELVNRGALLNTLELHQFISVLAKTWVSLALSVQVLLTGEMLLRSSITPGYDACQFNAFARIIKTVSVRIAVIRRGRPVPRRSLGEHGEHGDTNPRRYRKRSTRCLGNVSVS